MNGHFALELLNANWKCLYLGKGAKSGHELDQVSSGNDDIFFALLHLSAVAPKTAQ